MDPRPDRNTGAYAAGRALSIVAVLFAAGLFLLRLQSPAMHTPLTYDELLTVENYTWKAFDEDANPRRIRRADEFLDGERPGIRQLVAGAYRALGVWREPNNHVPHSLMVNAALAAGPPGNATVRFPAWLGAVVFSGAVAWLAFATGCRSAWPFALLLAAAWPYVAQYSVAARGYSWMLAFQCLALLALDASRRVPASILLGIASTAASVALFFDVVSLGLDWLLPLYLAAFLFPGLSVEAARSWRRNLLVRGLFLGWTAFLFFWHHLPYLVLSADAFGLSTSDSGFWSRAAEWAAYLAPSPIWTTVAIVGMFGWLGLLRAPATRWLGAAALGSVLVTSAHFLITGTFAYPRVGGFLIPLWILGFAHLLERGASRLGAHGHAAAIAITTVLMLTVAMSGEESASSPLEAFRAQTAKHDPGGNPYLVFDTATPYVLTRHLPNAFLTATDELDLVRSSTRLGFLRMSADDHSMNVAQEAGLGRSAGEMSIDWHSVRSTDFSTTASPVLFPALLLWVPDPDRTGLRGERLREALGADFNACLLHHRKRFHKLEFTNQIYSVECLVHDTEQWELVATRVSEALSTLQGDAVLLIRTDGGA